MTPFESPSTEDEEYLHIHFKTNAANPQTIRGIDNIKNNLIISAIHAIQQMT
jgi:hypothetical protein